MRTALTPEAEHLVCRWLLGNDTGISSRVMAATFLGSPLDSRWGPMPPGDPSDFGRCHRLLEAVPDLRPLLPMLKKHGEVWSRLVDRWDELTALYLEELPSGSCPKLYQAMQDLGC